MQKQLSLGQSFTVSELCLQLEIPKRTIQDTINRLYPGFMEHGKTTYLDEIKVTEISKELKKAHNLKSADTRTVATTDLELIHRSRDLLLDLTARLDQQDKELTILRPKAALADLAIRDEKEHYSITDAGKHLGLKRKEIFALLRSNGLLTKDSLPTQTALNYEILDLRTNSDINGRNRPQSIMTMKNIFNFKERYIK